MQELKDGKENGNISFKDGFEKGIKENSQLSFLDLSSKWADYTLKTHKDKLLDKGLAISKALAEFHCELVSPE